jgi:hypothetical protein
VTAPASKALRSTAAPRPQGFSLAELSTRWTGPRGGWTGRCFGQIAGERGGRDSNASEESAPNPEKTAGSALPPPAGEPESARVSEPLAVDSRTLVEPEPKVTVDLLRRKLDAAILAEAWEAVKVIRERIVEVELPRARRVVDLGPRSHRRS